MQLITIAAMLVVTVGLHLLIRHTRFGAAMRAVGWNQTAASLGGVNPRHVVIITAFIAGATSGLAGVLGGITTQNVSFLLGEGLLLKGFAAVVVGGYDDVRGTAIAGVGARRPRGDDVAVPLIGPARRHHLRAAAELPAAAAARPVRQRRLLAGLNAMQALCDFWAAYQSTIAFAIVNAFFALSTYAVLSAGILSFATVTYAAIRRLHRRAAGAADRPRPVAASCRPRRPRARCSPMSSP